MSENTLLDRAFLDQFFKNTGFPEDARQFLSGLAKELAEDLDRLLICFEVAYDHEAAQPLVGALAEKSGYSPYSIWMVVLILAAKKARPLYHSEEIYWDTFCDLRCKAIECHDLYGVWGTFVAHWYPRFYKSTIVKLGRLEYETRPCPFEVPQTVLDITIRPSAPILYIHIPSTGEPFDRKARLESYKKAWEYFCPDGKPLVCVCASWLLYSEYDRVFAPGSNIASFRKDFHMLSSKQANAFGNAWRVFGKDHTLPPEQLPERTALQRAFKAHILSGGTHGSGTGVLIFDGQSLVTENS